MKEILLIFKQFKKYDIDISKFENKILTNGKKSF